MPHLYIKIHFLFGYVCHLVSNRLKIRTSLEFPSDIKIAHESQQFLDNSPDETTVIHVGLLFSSTTILPSLSLSGAHCVCVYSGFCWIFKRRRAQVRRKALPVRTYTAAITGRWCLECCETSKTAVPSLVAWPWGMVLMALTPSFGRAGISKHALH